MVFCSYLSLEDWAYLGMSEFQEVAILNIDSLVISELRQEWANLIQMTIISIMVGKNPLGEME